jgi:hypothetical protein
MENLSVFGDIGNVLGYPAMLLIFWLYMKIKDIQKRLDDGDLRFREQEAKLTDIRDDVKFIRGFLEGKKEDKQ